MTPVCTGALVSPVSHGDLGKLSDLWEPRWPGLYIQVEGLWLMSLWKIPELLLGAQRRAPASSLDGEAPELRI